MKKITVYCDGASKGNPGPGGFGIVMQYREHTKEIYGGTNGESTTNNIMELTAPLRALQALKEPCEVEIFTDSKYVVDGMSKWIINWKKNNWKTSDKKPVKNVELWMALDGACNFHQVTFNWVKGHNNHPLNERADELANIGVYHENN